MKLTHKTEYFQLQLGQ